uniref:Pentacotripeptide-repeat region of PRORP domain-containing protein n=1 Tax=Fagus sylvatica TaxID=28930 RepID=A0A2N9G3N5_FAGSY
MAFEHMVGVVNRLMHRYETVGGVVRGLESIGCLTKAQTFLLLLRIYWRGGMYHMVFEAFEQMGCYGFSPNTFARNVIMDVLFKIGRVDVAIKVLKETQLPNFLTFNIALCNLYCLSKVGRYDDALDVFLYNDMLDRGFTPDKYSFVGLLSGLCGARRIDEAVNVYHGIIMNFPGQDAHIQTVITDGLIKAGKFYRAIRVFRKAVVEKYPLDAVSYTVAIRGLVKSGRTGDASTLYNQMKEASISPNAHTYNVMLYVFHRERDLKMVIQLLQEMIDARIELSCNNYIRLCNFLCRSHNSDSAVNLSIKMRDLRLIPAKAMRVPLSEEHVQGLKVDNESYLLLKDYLGNDLFVGTSGSEDLSDVAASVG